MSTLSRMAVIGIVAVSFFSATIVLADTRYDNDLGQSAQLSHTVQDQRSHSASIQDGHMEGDKKMANQENRVVEKFRQRNTLGQSDAMSKTRPYTSLIMD